MFTSTKTDEYKPAQVKRKMTRKLKRKLKRTLKRTLKMSLMRIRSSTGA
jgi:hypothetical protein